MIRVFYSQPFHNRSERDIFLERENLARTLRIRYGEDVEIIDQYHQIGLRLEILGNDIKLIGSAQIIVVSENWKTAKGCKIEKFILDTYKIPYIMFDPNTLCIY